VAGRFRLYSDTDIDGQDDPFAAYPILHIKPRRLYENR
jgi:hypothetical protein